ncbi:SKP1/BTB/POZ domain, NPH3 domain protein [Artemisia annua]|uniref:SKP1/BTB/POZ domain, NPH3 domain protein n=1 Tax=Artemisia annua TaxID=35608 RepID=A0A2U1KXM9_ARTAN|nr:SKP1/BTB/POZ domain, NPH3 domain protein [Artemisia annua]
MVEVLAFEGAIKGLPQYAQASFAWFCWQYVVSNPRSEPTTSRLYTSEYSCGSESINFYDLDVIGMIFRRLFSACVNTKSIDLANEKSKSASGVFRRSYLDKKSHSFINSDTLPYVGQRIKPRDPYYNMYNEVTSNAFTQELKVAVKNKKQLQKISSNTERMYYTWSGPLMEHFSFVDQLVLSVLTENELLEVNRVDSHAKANVAKIIDDYLAEFARDANMSLIKFADLADMVSSLPRSTHDGIYHAIDMHLKFMEPAQQFGRCRYAMHLICLSWK